MNILEKKKKISKNQQKINSIKKNGKSANEHLTQTSPYPDLIPVVSSKGEKYVRSEPNDTPRDNLLRLPRV